jgi:hypothetical protein
MPCACGVTPCCIAALRRKRSTSHTCAPSCTRLALTVFAQYYRDLTSLANKTLESKPDSARERGNSLSGPGSNAEETLGVRTALPALLALTSVRTLLDVPCGDFNYMRAVLSAPMTPPGIEYIGMDIVSTLVGRLQATFGTAHRQEVRTAPSSNLSTAGSHSNKRHRISFQRFDLAQEFLWPADLVVVRDILFHFELGRAVSVLRRVGLSGCRFALITYFPRVDNRFAARKYHPGRGFGSYASWNLEAAPFALPPPLLAIGKDGNRKDRVMGLWRCASLRAEV